MKQTEVKIKFEYYSSTNKLGIFKETKIISIHESLRNVGLSVIKRAIDEGADIWNTTVNKNTPISMYLESKDVSNLNSGFAKTGFGIKYKIAKNESIIMLDGYDTLHSDWTFNELILLKECGYIEGNPKSIIIGVPEGLGGGEYGALDWFSFLIDIFAAYEIVKIGTSIASKRVNDKTVAKITRQWAENNIHYPHQLREFINTKAEWKLIEVKKRLRLDEEHSIKLLLSLGLEPIDDGWRLTHSKNSIRKRKNWLKYESKYREVEDDE
jgi:hypothetical protein